MRKTILLCMLLCLALASSSVARASGPLALSSSTDNSIVSLEDFVYLFNFYGAFMADGHELNLKNTSEFTKIKDGYLYKSIFNECEILSLVVSPDIKTITRITCSWAINVPGAEAYLNDFLQMLTETFFACGMEEDSVYYVLEQLANSGPFDVGDSSTFLTGGMRISYEVTSYAGVSFVIERLQK